MGEGFSVHGRLEGEKNVTGITSLKMGNEHCMENGSIIQSLSEESE